MANFGNTQPSQIILACFVRAVLEVLGKTVFDASIARDEILNADLGRILGTSNRYLVATDKTGAGSQDEATSINDRLMDWLRAGEEAVVINELVLAHSRQGGNVQGAQPRATSPPPAVKQGQPAASAVELRLKVELAAMPEQYDEAVVLFRVEAIGLRANKKVRVHPVRPSSGVQSVDVKLDGFGEREGEISLPSGCPGAMDFQAVTVVNGVRIESAVASVTISRPDSSDDGIEFVALEEVLEGDDDADITLSDIVAIDSVDLSPAAQSASADEGLLDDLDGVEMDAQGRFVNRTEEVQAALVPPPPPPRQAAPPPLPPQRRVAPPPLPTNDSPPSPASADEGVDETDNAEDLLEDPPANVRMVVRAGSRFEHEGVPHGLVYIDLYDADGGGKLDRCTVNAAVEYARLEQGSWRPLGQGELNVPLPTPEGEGIRVPMNDSLRVRLPRYVGADVIVGDMAILHRDGREWTFKERTELAGGVYAQADAQPPEPDDLPEEPLASPDPDEPEAAEAPPKVGFFARLREKHGMTDVQRAELARKRDVQRSAAVQQRIKTDTERKERQARRDRDAAAAAAKPAKKPAEKGDGKDGEAKAKPPPASDSGSPARQAEPPAGPSGPPPARSAPAASAAAPARSGPTFGSP